MYNDEEKQKSKPKYINALLDINQFSGTTSKRLGPWIAFLCIACAPMLIWVYYFMNIIPFSAQIIFEIIWSLRFSLLILGDEQTRIAQYKKQIYDVYSSSYDLLGIKYIHDDGLVEYITGDVMYMLVAENGNREDDIYRAQKIRELLNMLEDHFVPDIHVQNISIGEVLAERYADIKMFADKEVMSDFIKLLDHNIQVADEESYLTRIIFAVHARKSRHNDLRSNLESIVKSCDSSVFKSLKIAEMQQVQMLISRDLDTYIDYEDLIMHKYATGEYNDSHVVGYDLIELDKQVYEKAKENDEEVGFIDDAES